jgi:predicted house-cleaning noncanonical NTP pyrophosphatase (MazG superfamily)
VPARPKNSKAGTAEESDENYQLTEREQHCLEAISRDVEARDALELLCRKSRRSKKFWITTIVLTVWSPQVLVDGPEISAAELKDLGNSLAEDAQKMKSLNKSEGFSRDSRLAGFLPLPTALEAYARLVLRKSEIAHQFEQIRHDEPTRTEIRRDLEGRLLEHVRSLTGRMYREKVAAILRVVNPIAGSPPVEAETLRKRTQRKRKSA